MIKNKHQRKSNRLKNCDYSKNGWYFVTVCTKNREEYFGVVANEKMILNKYGEITEECWLGIPNHFLNARLDEFIVMPNHIHGIVIIENNNVGARFIVPETNGFDKSNRFGFDKSNPYRGIKNNPMLLKNTTPGKIIRYYKAKTTYEIRKFIGGQFVKCEYFIWQRSFYDHIIRNELSLQQIRGYIQLNFLKWEEDTENPKNLKTA